MDFQHRARAQVGRCQQSLALKAPVSFSKGGLSFCWPVASFDAEATSGSA